MTKWVRPGLSLSFSRRRGAPGDWSVGPSYFSTVALYFSNPALKTIKACRMSASLRT